MDPEKFVEELWGYARELEMREHPWFKGFVEAMHGGPNGAAAGMFEALTKHYGFSKRAAATYELHAEQDTGHGDRQIDAIRRFARDEESQRRVRAAVKLGLNAFNFEWDGHVQAMTGKQIGRASCRV